jgi:thymidine phosphorylase
LEDIIDSKSGIRLLKKCGNAVKPGEGLAILYSDDPSAIRETSDHTFQAYALGGICPKPLPMVLKTI